MTTAWYGSVLFGVFLVLGCAKGPKRAEPSTSGLDAEHKHSEFSRDQGRFTAEDASPLLDVQSYSLKGHFNWPQARLFAEVSIKYAFSGTAGEKVTLNSQVSKVTGVRSEGEEVPFEINSAKGLLSFVPKTGGEIRTVTIQYEVQSNSSVLRNGQDALYAVTPRTGDPVRSKLVATFSEPTNAQLWMPCHDVTTDRALFSSEFALDDGEMLIANGDLTKDTYVDGQRVMSYSTQYTLPTYLMAFALGEFAQSSRQMGKLPIQIWYRKGLVIDDTGMLEALEHQMKVFEKLLIPYPFEKYALVLLPEFGGGIEHAGITFQGEVSSTRGELSRDFGLSAHELAHQWFGDLVTVTTWDDLWIKEGMATLLAEEASRKFEDRANSGRLFGSAFSVAPGDAVYDPSLAPEEKYTSGPYDRAGWVLTQVRFLIGEEKFWGTLKDVLKTYAFSTIGTEQFIAAFAPHLGREAEARLRQAIRAKALPELALSESGELSLTDPDSALIAPLVLSHADQEALSAKPFSISDKQNLKAMAQGFWVLDPNDVHPIEDFYSSEMEVALLAFLQPPPEGLHFWSTLAPQIQWRTLLLRAEWKFDTLDFSSFYRTLDSDFARYQALRQYCRTLDNTELEKGQAVLAPLLMDPPYFALSSRGVNPALSECPVGLAEVLFENELARVQRGLPLARGEADLALVSSFALPPDQALEVWSGLLSLGQSVRERLIAAGVLARHLTGAGAYAKPSEEKKAQWTQVLATALEQQTATEVGVPLLEGLRAAKDKSSLSSIAIFVNQNTNANTLTSAVCSAAKIAAGDAAAWQRFTGGVLASTLPATVQTLLNNPAACENRKF